MRKTMILAAVAISALLVFPVSPALAEVAGHGGHDHSQHGGHGSGSSSHQVVMDKIFEKYFAILASLTENSLEKVSANAETMAKTIELFQKGSVKSIGDEHKADLHTLMADIAAAARSLAEKKDIASARTEFGKLSPILVDYEKHFGGKESAQKRVYVCDMVKKVWLQEDDKPGNPYFGPSMAMCKRKLQ